LRFYVLVELKPRSASWSFRICTLLYSRAQLLFAGCSMPAPRAEIATADMAVRQARQSRAPQYSRLELRTATEKLNGARQAMADEDYLLARRLAEQARVDAQLAETKAQTLEA
jgi:hypothetical protein